VVTKHARERNRKSQPASGIGGRHPGITGTTSRSCTQIRFRGEWGTKSGENYRITGRPANSARKDKGEDVVNAYYKATNIGSLICQGLQKLKT